MSLMGSYKWGYKSPNRSYNYSYLTYISTSLQVPFKTQRPGRHGLEGLVAVGAEKKLGTHPAGSLGLGFRV